MRGVSWRFLILTRSKRQQGPEVDIDLIRTLEKQIEERDGDIIKFKRDRNSLLNISTRAPPEIEILGGIFVWRHVRELSFQ